MKLTKNRQKILDILLNSKKPVTAKKLKSEVSFDLSTIYRSLDFLEKNSYIFSFDFENEKYYFKDENIELFICNSCKNMEDISNLTNNKNNKSRVNLQKKGFSFISHLSIVKGHCNDCKKNNTKI